MVQHAKSLGAPPYCFRRCEVPCSGYTKCVGAPLAFPSDEYFILCVNKSFPLTLCCQAGLHLSETERQPHGDPQQGRWDWKVGCGYTSGDEAGVILWSDISCLERGGSRIVFHVRHALGTSGVGGWFKKTKTAPPDLWEWKIPFESVLLWSGGSVHVTALCLHHSLQWPVNSELFQGSKGAGEGRGVQVGESRVFSYLLFLLLLFFNHL